jgi:CrcB protein
MFEEGVQRYVRSLALVAGGGALGASARYGVGLVVPSALGATFAANVVGCFLLGALVTVDRRGSLVSERERLLFATGFCSSFTTYSTFVLDAVESAPTVAAGYVLGSYAVGFAAVGLGTSVGRRTAPESGGEP